MDTKFTPGPWEFTELKGTDSRGMGYIAANGHDIIHAGVMDLPTAENRANARLIAAAPDLLAALQMIVHNYYTGNYSAIDMPQGRDAIDKALGCECAATHDGPWAGVHSSNCPAVRP